MSILIAIITFLIIGYCVIGAIYVIGRDGLILLAIVLTISALVIFL